MQNSVSVLLDEFLACLKSLERSPHYIKDLRSCVLRLFRSAGWKDVKEVNVAGFERWRARSGLCAKTKNNYQRCLSSFCHWLLDHDYISSNPMVRVHPCPIFREENPRRALTMDEVQRLLEVAPPRRRLVYLTAVYTGLRRNELFSITWDDLVFGDNPCVVIPAYISKNRKRQIIPLREELAEILRANRPFRYHKVNVFKRFYKCFRYDFNNAGIPPRDDDGRRADFHSLRKSFCTFLFLNGGSPRVVQELMRHSDYKLTAMCYTDVRQMDSSLRDKGVNLLPWLGK